MNAIFPSVDLYEAGRAKQAYSMPYFDLSPPFSQGKWQNSELPETSVGCYLVESTVPGSQMDSRMP